MLTDKLWSLFFSYGKYPLPRMLWCIYFVHVCLKQTKKHQSSFLCQIFTAVHAAGKHLFLAGRGGRFNCVSVVLLKALVNCCQFGSHCTHTLCSQRLALIPQQLLVCKLLQVLCKKPCLYCLIPYYTIPALKQEVALTVQPCVLCTTIVPVLSSKLAVHI